MALGETKASSELLLSDKKPGLGQMVSDLHTSRDKNSHGL